ncbi:TIGR02530 family flagellar biosynthesis protein [Clostridium chauvoei]|uniref:Flagellar biosynthesis protein n=2 Tax=Clostridium chauvoei TaxID=46867 RepID=A0ABD4RF73_9CLOT|nr:TIGR02530 family flagellar biosynthesis protein [Clostridium chauvoei]ATD54640.1 flagellar biosynthesis protein [Clostridium chauvoei]ATD57678.1 flagellar biosynthesis protein [Clostridium chauvoei]MBX7279933.1 flagellar biosynthesis protein [Clostridium chauvoei]MBX7282408.1 flagellar biosynthesis protein [Clostridium chauvoei]MBX7284824.1 flagellar biosynthesis protein [Clostridium chauvoei]
MGFRIINGVPYQVGNFQTPTSTNLITTKKSGVGNSFKDVLNEKIDKEDGYKLSKHAAERLKLINFNNQDMKAIEKGFEIAENKGCKNSVMLYKDIALIASIENKTIITAVEKERAKDNVFTNVDSVVIL